MLFKNSKTTKELKETSCFILYVYVAMWPLITYSNCFEIVSTVNFLDSQTGLISDMFVFKTVLLYHFIFIHYKIIMIIQDIIFAAPGF